jgi:DNA primase
VLCFDSDEAGQNATVRSLDHLLASGLAVRVAVVPRPHDPDTFIKAHGADAFRQLIDQADGFFDYYLSRLCATSEAATDKGRLTIVRSMAEGVNKTGNAVLIDKYAQKTALRLGVSSDSVRAEFKRLRRQGSSRPDDGEEETSEAVEIQRPSTHEYWLLKLLMLREDLVAWCNDHLDPQWIQHTLARQIIVRRLEAQRDQTWTSLGAFLDGCETAEMRSLITEAATEERPIPNPGQQLGDVVQRLRNQFIDRQLMALIHRANQQETEDAAKLDILRQQHELRQLKRRPIPPPGN